MLEPYNLNREISPLILIAEEDVNVRSHLSQILEINGYRVVEVADGRTCLAVVARLQPDLIILNTLLPTIDGWTCCWELRTEAESQFTPILLLLAELEADAIDQAFAAGASDCWVKPMNDIAFLQQVQQILALPKLHAGMSQQNRIFHRQLQKRTQELRRTEVTLRQVQIQERGHIQAKTQFLSTVAHELRTPLTTILASAEFLEYLGLADATVPHGGEYFDRIRTAVDQMLETLERTAAIASINAETLELDPTIVDLTEVCKNSVTDWQIQKQETHQISFCCDEELPVLAYVDSDLLQQLLNQLLSNAVRFSPEGGEIRVNLYSAIAGSDAYKRNSVAILQVEDHGVGIPETDQAHLFRQFYRGGNANQIPGTPGLGLGLTIVKQIVELHNGKITFHSRPGKGTTFTISLPLQSATVLLAAK